MPSGERETRRTHWKSPPLVGIFGASPDVGSSSAELRARARDRAAKPGADLNGGRPRSAENSGVCSEPIGLFTPNAGVARGRRRAAFPPDVRQGESLGRPAQAVHVISTSSAPDGRLELCDGSAGQRHLPCSETIASLLLPARLSRETPFQAIEIYCLLATL